MHWSNYFRGRWNNYKYKKKSFTRREKCTKEHLYKYFESEGHTEFLDDVSIHLLIRQTALIPLRERITGCKPLKHMHLTALMLQIVSSLDVERDEIFLFFGISRNLDFDKYLGYTIWTRFDNS